MKKILRLDIIITVLMAAVFLCTGLSQGQEENEEAIVVIGEIIEIVPNDQIIQVGNRNYIVKSVFIDDGSAKGEVVGRFGNLTVGSLVGVYEGGKSEGFWKAEKVVLFQGVKKQQILDDRQQ